MKIGDLVRHKMIKKSRQVGVITEARYSGGYWNDRWKYKVLWACTGTEEYWFTRKEVESII